MNRTQTLKKKKERKRNSFCKRSLWKQLDFGLCKTSWEFLLFAKQYRFVKNEDCLQVKYQKFKENMEISPRRDGIAHCSDQCFHQRFLLLLPRAHSWKFSRSQRLLWQSTGTGTSRTLEKIQGTWNSKQIHYLLRTDVKNIAINISSEWEFPFHFLWKLFPWKKEAH